jgi:hypothetical protein
MNRDESCPDSSRSEVEGAFRSAIAIVSAHTPNDPHLLGWRFVLTGLLTIAYVLEKRQ